MIAIPAVDLREGACVQLVGGSYEDERVRIADPLSAVQRWVNAGFRVVHVVDLDAATGRGGNRPIVERILANRSVSVQVGGGVRTEADVRSLLDAGAERVVVGTRALEDRDWLARTSTRFPGRLIVAADVRGRCVVLAGWARDLALDPVDLVSGLAGFPLGGVLVTAVHREGRMEGTDLPLMADVVRVAEVPVYASGGISTLDDLRALAKVGCAGAVLGMALYTGALDPRGVAEEFIT